MKKQIIYLVILLLSITSCDRLAKDVEAPKIESKLVVFSFLSPDENFIKIEVSMSKTVYGSQKGNTDAVDDAIVTIKNEGGFSATLPFVDTVNAYYIPSSLYTIEAGRTYTVNVSAKGKSVSASCTVPNDTVAFNGITYQKLSQSATNLGSSPYYRYSYKWQDQQGIKNYYRVSIENYYTYVDFFSGDSITTNNEICTSMWSDEDRDGNVLSSVCEDYNYYGDQGSGTGQSIKFYLLNTDAHYYEYHKRRLYYYGEDPFSEPFQQYSNVKDGLGVVCAYRKSKSLLIVN